MLLFMFMLAGVRELRVRSVSAVFVLVANEGRSASVEEETVEVV